MRAALTLQTQRLCVAQVGPEFAAACVTYYRENAEHFAPWDPPQPVGLYEEGYWRMRLSENLLLASRGEALPLMIFEGSAAEGPIVGTINFSHFIRGAFQAATVGYSLHHAVVGRGYMSEALGAAIDYAFNHLLLHRIMLNYIPENTRSAAVAKRLGFVIEGHAKEYLYINGAWRDHVLTSRTNARLDRPAL